MIARVDAKVNLFKELFFVLVLCGLCEIVTTGSTLCMAFLYSLSASRAVSLATIRNNPNQAQNDVNKCPKENYDSNSEPCSDSSSHLTSIKVAANQAVTIR